jgi:hypothetical protein
VFGVDRTPNTSHDGTVLASSDEALGLVVEAMCAVGIPATSRSNDGGADLDVVIGGIHQSISLKTMGTVTPATWHTQLSNFSSAGEGPIQLIVADRVVGAARDLLRAHGQSWLDLRGHLYLTGPGVLVDLPVPPMPDRPSSPRNPLSGSVALEIACELLMSPERQHAVRELARTLNRSPSSISTAMSGLRDARLVTARGEAVIPQLFWETAAAWKPASTAVARLSIIDDPVIASALKTGRGDPESPGWALTDSLAAAAYGAPTGVRTDYPPDLYVPDTTTARRAETLLGLPTSTAARGATIKIAPVPQICTRRNPPRTGGWPLAHPLFVALDLAGDPSRGVEIIEAWQPRKGIDRVW